ncbi:hypothetical protein SH467x_003569 [Pirellulaceae bacterium SH467]|jgi:hypothetical protein
MQQWIAPILVLSAIGVAWLLQYWVEKRRREKLRAFAEELGLELHEELPGDDRSLFGGFPFSRRGDRQTAGWTITIDDGQTRVVLFDFQTVSGSGKNKSTRNYVLSLVTDRGVRAPYIEIVPKTWGLKLGKWFGRKSIELPDDPAFSDRYRILGDPEDQVCSFLTSSRRLAIQGEGIKSFSAAGNTFLLEHEEKKLKAVKVRELLNRSLALCKSLR